MITYESTYTKQSQSKIGEEKWKQHFWAQNSITQKAVVELQARNFKPKTNEWRYFKPNMTQRNIFI